MLRRIKTLEETVLILINLLRKHSVSIPDDLSVPTVPSSQNISTVKLSSSFPTNLIEQSLPSVSLPNCLPALSTTTAGPVILLKEKTCSVVQPANLNKVIYMRINEPLPSSRIDSSELNPVSSKMVSLNPRTFSTKPLILPKIIPTPTTKQPEIINEPVSTAKITLVGESATQSNPSRESGLKGSLWRPDPSLSASTHSEITPEMLESSEVHFIRITESSIIHTATKESTVDSCNATINQHTSSVNSAGTTNTTVASCQSTKPMTDAVVNKQAVPCKMSQQSSSNRKCLAVISSGRISTAPRGMVKSPIQAFGIENILVTNDTQELLSKDDSANTVVPSSLQTSEQRSKSNLINSTQPVTTLTLTSRPRLPSNGHTVAALLENCGENSTKTVTDCGGTSKKKNSKIAKTTGTSLVTAMTTTPFTKNPSKSALSATTTPSATSTTSTDSSITSKRWETIVKNAQNSNMFLTSFYLEKKVDTNKNSKRKHLKATAPRANRNLRRSRSKNRTNRKSLDIPTTSSTSEKVDVDRTKETVAVDRNLNAETFCKNLLTYSKATDNLSTICISASSKETTHLMSLKTAALNQVQQLSQNTTPPVGRKVNETTKPIQNSRTENNQLETTTSLPPQSIRKPIVTHKVNTKIFDSSSASTPSLRTMKDRTIKNKWVSSESTQPVAPSISVSMSDTLNEQCASPVISYPNSVRRKRKSSTSQSVNPSKRSTVNVEHQHHRTNNSSQDFSAESLSRSSSLNEKKTSNKNNEQMKTKTSVKVKNSKNTISTKQTSLAISLPSNTKDIQRLRHQPDTASSNSNTLPTILNIFAPAPVPTTTSQQQTFQSAFSNFSAETLLGNECNLGVMDTNSMGDTGFNENMMMAESSQLFTNFSADTLISGNDTSLSFAVNNLVNQTNTNWNQPWLGQDMNEAMFTSMSNINNANNRHRSVQISTECSPIKSIMSILNSTPSNNSNFPFDNYNNGNNTNNILPNNFPHHHNRFPIIRDNRNGSTDVTGGSGVDLMTNLPNFPSMWMSRPPNPPQNFKNNFALNTSGMNTWEMNFVPSHNTVKVPNRSTTAHQSVMMQSGKATEKAVKEKSGPTLGNFSLINSGTPT